MKVTLLNNADNSSLVASFITSVKGDLDSPVTSNFGNRVGEYRAQAQRIADEIDGDSADFERMRRIAKEIEETLGSISRLFQNFGHVSKELAEKWSARSDNEDISDAAITLMKVELFMKEESELACLQARNWHNNVVHPLDLLIAAPSDLRFKAVDKACRDYENKYVKCESEARKQARQSGYSRSHLNHGELAEQLSRERLLVQYEMCKFLLGVNALEDKRGPQTLRHFIELFRNRDQYFSDCLKMNEDFRRDLEKLENSMNSRCGDRCQYRNSLFALKDRLEAQGEFVRTPNRRTSSGRMDASRTSLLPSASAGINNASASVLPGVVSNLQGIDNDSFNDFVGTSSSFSELPVVGYLYKKSNKKLHKQWQKRKCRIEEGYFLLSHSDTSLPPTRMDLLIADCKPSADDPRTFDLYSRHRTYHLQADSEAEAKRWVSALKLEIDRVKKNMLSADDPGHRERLGIGTSSEWFGRKLCIGVVRRLPGNNECADCSSTEDVQWLSNTGALVCITCSGVHRELGVHVSRIQSLELDVMSPNEFLVPLATGNAMVNRLLEFDEDMCSHWKPCPSSSRSDRQKFIQSKYRDHSYVCKMNDADALFSDAVRELDVEKAYSALLSPYLTSAPFDSHGSFHQMVKSCQPMALPIAQLVVQTRTDISGLEIMLTDCVRMDNADMLAVLLHCQSLNKESDISLESLAFLAKTTGSRNVSEMLNGAVKGDRTCLNRINIPSALFEPSSESDSMSLSSSSISPMAKPSFESSRECANDRIFPSPPPVASNTSISPSPPNTITDSLSAKTSPVAVLMRNGTTIAVDRAPTEPNAAISDDPVGHTVVVQQNVRSARDSSHSRPQSAFVVSPELNICTASSFTGSTFGKLPGTSRTEDKERRRESLIIPNGSKMRQNDEIASFISRSVSSHVPASDRYERICLQRNDKISNAIPSCSSSLENGRPETAASAEDVRSPRSRATKPFVQVQPNPRPYHRSASEYHYVASESPRYQQFHNAPSGVTSQTHQRVFSERECHTKPSVTPTSMTSSFLTAQSSMSLDPIPLMTSSPKLHGLSSKSSSNERDHNLTRDRPSSLTRNEMIDQNVPMVRSAERDVGNSQGSSSVDTANRTGRIPPASRTDRSVQGTGITRANTVHQIEMNSKPWAPRDPLNIDNHPTQVASQGIKKSRAPPLPPVTSGLKFKPPIPVPRRTSTMSKPPIRTARRCRALYDCEADNPDELSFRQGDTIVVSKEKIAGENDTWMEGYLLNNPQTRGMFPVTFVTFIS